MLQGWSAVGARHGLSDAAMTDLEFTPVNCWEDGADHGVPGTTCLLLDGHDGPHVFTPDSKITVGFYTR